MKLWTFDPNLHLSLADTTFCLPSCFVCFFVCLLSHLFVHLACLIACHLLCLPCLSYLSVYALFICSLYLFLPLLVCQFLVFAFASTHVERGRMELGHSLLSTSKKGEDASTQVRLSSCNQQVQGLAFSFLVMYSFKPLPSFSLSPLDSLYQVYHALYHSSSSLEYGDPCLLSCIYILSHALGMQTFTFLLCVLALCMIYVYIYLLIPLQCDCHSPCHLRQAMPSFHCESKEACCRIFIAKIQYSARMPQESIDWDHTFSNAKPQSSHACKASKANAESMFPNLQKLRFYQNKGLSLGQALWGV